ncbi:8685_t:CDS:2, partial [Cetraspora pellucida]
AANNYYNDNNVLKNYDNESLFAHNELIEIENDNAEGFAKTLLNAATTFYYESDSNKFYKTAKEDIEVELSNDGWLDEVDEDDTRGLLEDKIETSNWYKKIQTALENITLDIKNKNVNSEVWINEVILPGLRFVLLPTISLNTAKNYLKELGYIYKRVKKFEYRMPVFSDEDMEVEIWPDSSIPEGEQPLRKKGEGYSIHVSKFLTNKSEDLIEQVFNCAISIFEACFLRCQALFAFDNAKSYTTYTSDAFVAKNMNLSSAGKQEKMHSTSYFHKGIKND